MNQNTERDRPEKNSADPDQSDQVCTACISQFLSCVVVLHPV